MLPPGQPASGHTHLKGFLGGLTLFFPARDDDDVTPPGGARVGLFGVPPISGIVTVLLDWWLYTVNWGDERGRGSQCRLATPWPTLVKHPPRAGGRGREDPRAPGFPGGCELTSLPQVELATLEAGAWEAQRPC